MTVLWIALGIVLAAITIALAVIGLCVVVFALVLIRVMVESFEPERAVGEVQA